MSIFSINGALSSSNVVFSAGSTAPITLTYGGTSVTSWKAHATGYYIIAANLRSTTPVSRDIARTILLRLDMPPQYWFSEQYGTLTIPQTSGQYVITTNICQCIFFNVNDIITFQWINATGITNSVAGTFSIVRIFPTTAVNVNLTCTLPVNTWIQPTCTVSETTHTDLVKNNIYKCNSNGLYFISISCASQTGASNTGRNKITLQCNVKSENVTKMYYSENLNVHSAVSWGCISKILPLNLNDEISFSIRNPVIADKCYYGKCVIFKMK